MVAVCCSLPEQCMGAVIETSLCSIMQSHMWHTMPKNNACRNACATAISRPVQEIAHLDRAEQNCCVTVPGHVTQMGTKEDAGQLLVKLTLKLMATVLVTLTVSVGVAVTVKVPLTVLVT